jgi:methyl-accepting chemotaxis protein
MRLTYRFAALIATFAILTFVSATILWEQFDTLRAARVDIIRRQYPARIAIVEAKASEAVFNAFAYRLLHPNKDDARELSLAIKEEAARFRNWMETAKSFLPEENSELQGISARFDKLVGFLDTFDRLEPSAETREFQVEYRFEPLRDDLEAALTHVSNNIAIKVQDRIKYVDDVVFRKFQISCAVFAVGFVLFFAGTLLWASFAIARPILRLADAMRDIANDRFEIKLHYTKRTDEVGEMARAVKIFRDKGRAVKRLEAETTANKTRAKQALVAERERVVEVFRQDVMEVVAALSSASAEMQRNAASVRDMAREADTQTKSVVESSQNAVQTVETLSMAANELATLLDRGNSGLYTAAQIATKAAEDGNLTSVRANQLAEAVETIGQIADFISSVAYQTNLLSLNETIEAARCGEAGRGFAVVAAEVKGLAQETGRAAANIAERIGTVKAATEQVVSAIGVSVERIGHIGAITDRFGDAIGAREKATRKITLCVDAAADGAQSLATTLHAVAASTSASKRISTEMLIATDELSQQAERLVIRSREFCTQIRAESVA